MATHGNAANTLKRHEIHGGTRRRTSAKEFFCRVLAGFFYFVFLINI
jgi:hypothetical protein